MSQDTISCLALTGPTACGKTELALALAAEFPIEIISMDSAMVYRGMDIGTAKPDRETLQRVPHHLIDICDPEEPYSAGRFAGDARRLLGGISRRGRTGLVVGGTMLYLKALREGIAPLPERDEAVRAVIDAEACAEGWEALHRRLARIDPEAARRIEPTDRQRIQRALEVHALTGETISALQRSPQAAPVAVECIAVVPEDRSQLARRIERRFDAMVDQGLVDEVRRLKERPGLSADSTSMRAVGYRQLWAWLDGQTTWDEARFRAITATRQLAKRQLTWLRGDPASWSLSAADPILGRRVGNIVREHIGNA